MGLLLLEALAVLGIAIFIVWWTMFSGRGKADAAAPGDDESSISGSPSRDDREAQRNASGTAGGSGESARKGPGAD